jgi:hypothetical protein
VKRVSLIYSLSTRLLRHMMNFYSFSKLRILVKSFKMIYPLSMRLLNRMMGFYSFLLSKYITEKSHDDWFISHKSYNTY